jgi:rubrerythrin
MHFECSTSARRSIYFEEAPMMDAKQFTELVLQALETELGGVQVYENAVECAVNDDLRREWEEYLGQTENHVKILHDLCEKLGIDPQQETPGRRVVRHIGQALVRAMQLARENGTPVAAQLVAAECVVLAETKDHQNWELLGLCAEKLDSKRSKMVRDAQSEVEEQEDEHLYHTTGWSRELWIQSLGMPAVLPPPEEEKEVKTAIGAARAKQARKEML